MEILNFTNTKYGKTYYSTNKQWKYIKQRVKQILDEKESCREYKIDMIISLLENYKSTYLRSKGDKNVKD